MRHGRRTRIAAMLPASAAAMALATLAGAQRAPSAPTPPQQEQQAQQEAPTVAPRAWLGVSLRTPPEALLAQLGVDGQGSMLIESVAEGSPAQRAGLERFDLILGVAGEDGARAPLLEAVRAARPGDTITIGFVRRGEERSVAVTLARRPDAEAPTPPGAAHEEDEVLDDALDHARWALEQARKGLQEQEWLDFGDRFEGLDFERFDLEGFEMEFDEEAFQVQMQAFSARMDEFSRLMQSQASMLERTINQRLAPMMEEVDRYVDRVSGVLEREAESALSGPLARRLERALTDAEVQAEQIAGATEQFLDEIGYSLRDGTITIEKSAEEIERALRKALEDAGVEEAELDRAVRDAAAWLEGWSAEASDSARRALERLEREFESRMKEFEQGDPAPERPDEEEDEEEAPIARPSSGERA